MNESQAKALATITASASYEESTENPSLPSYKTIAKEETS